MIKLIVAVDEKYGIGYDGELLFSVKEDMQRFKELTTGHYVVMGRKTFESLPKTLPNRKNIVLTRDVSFNPNDPSVFVETSFERMTRILYKGYLEKQRKDIWVIGGSEIYEAFLPYADEVHITHVHKIAHKVDTYFPHRKMIDEGFSISEVRDFYSDVECCKVTFATYRKPL